jgi:hypothetical protein
MPLSFLIFTNLVLILRLRPLLVEPSGDPAFPWKTAAAELVALFLLFELCVPLYLAAAAVVALNVLPGYLAKRHRYGNGARFILGLLLLLVFSILFSGRAGVHFRPMAGYAAERIFSWTAFGSRLRSLAQPRAMTLLLGLLLAASEANLLIRWCIDFLKIRPKKIISGGGEDSRGRVIGLIERALIFFFVVNGQFGAIGFVLAAKAFTRFKDLDERDFAEYVLIGTLLSSSIAMAIGVFFSLPS